MNGASNDRAQDARDHDDHELIDSMTDAPGGQGRSGGRLARDVATQDELKRATDPDAGVTRATKQDKRQPQIPTRADNEGAQTESRLSPSGKRD